MLPHLCKYFPRGYTFHTDEEFRFTMALVVMAALVSFPGPISHHQTHFPSTDMVRYSLKTFRNNPDHEEAQFFQVPGELRDTLRPGLAIIHVCSPIVPFTPVRDSSGVVHRFTRCV